MVNKINASTNILSIEQREKLKLLLLKKSLVFPWLITPCQFEASSKKLRLFVTHS